MMQPKPSPSVGQEGASRLRGVAFLGFSTESSHGARADAALVDRARELRRRGIPSVLLQVHFHATDEAENRKRADALVERVVTGRFKWVVCGEMWTAELGRRLTDAGVRIVERRSQTLADGHLSSSLADLPLDDCSTGAPLDEYKGLVEVLGQVTARAIKNVDLALGHACSFQGGLAENPFFAEIASEPVFASHRGCAHCFNSISSQKPAPAATPIAILEEVRKQRATLPDLEVVWMPFAEVIFEALGAAFDQSRGDAVWRGLTLAMQLRPDVVVNRKADIELVAAKAHDAGTVIKIAVIGYENFSAAELLVLNRGVTPDDLRNAAAILAAWQREPAQGLEVRNYVPSFILFTPWTTLEDLELNLAEIQTHGLSNANVERLRLGRATPLHEMARRQGLTSPEPVRLAVHPNGYFAEAAIRFKDARVAAACDGFDALKPLAFEQQAPLLAAIVDAVRRSRDPSSIDWSKLAATWQRVKQLAASSPHVSRPSPDASIDPVGVRDVLARNGIHPRERLSDYPQRPRALRSVTATDESVGFAVGEPCNNGCDPCVWSRRLAFRPDAALPPSQSVVKKRVHLAGREPTMRQDLPAIVRGMRDAGAGRVEIDTNGRRFLYPSYVHALDVAGLDSAVVKLFGTTASAWDAHTREPGSFAQTIEGLAVVAHVAPAIALTGMVFPGAAGGTIEEHRRFAGALGLARLIVVLRLAAQDVLDLAAVEAAIVATHAATDGPATFFSVD